MSGQTEDREIEIDLDEQDERIRRNVSSTRELAREMEFFEDLDFDLTIPEPERRTLMKAMGGAAVTGALAGCMDGEEPQQPEQQDGEDGEPTQTTDDGEAKVVQMEAHQWEFAPQKIQVAEKGTPVKIEFTKSTVQEEPSYSGHSFFLPAFKVGPVELPEDNDPDVDTSVEFVPDEEGTFPFQCAIYCGTNHANMRGELVVGEGGQNIDYSEMQNVEDSQTIETDPSELPQEMQYDVDIRDMMVVTERENRSVVLIDSVNHEVLERVSGVGDKIHVHDFPDTLIEGKREGAYVYTLSRQGLCNKIDLFGGNRVARVQGGTDARKPQLSRDNNYIALGMYNPNQLVIADAEDLSPEKIIPTTGVTNPDGETVGSRICAVHDIPDQGKWVVALKEGGQVWFVDYTQDDFPVVGKVEVGRVLHDAFFTQGTRYFNVASQEDNIMGVVDTQEMELVKKVPTGNVPHPGTPYSHSSEHNLAWTVALGDRQATFYDAETFEVKKQLEVPGSGLFSNYHPDGSKIWADVMLDSESGRNSIIYTMDPESMEVVDEIDTSQWGGKKALHPEFSRDGSEAFVSLWEAGKILVFDAETAELKDQIEGLKTPTCTFLAGRRALEGMEH